MNAAVDSCRVCRKRMRTRAARRVDELEDFAAGQAEHHVDAGVLQRRREDLSARAHR
jgi:hypothetical protein